MITTVRSRASDIYSLESVRFIPNALDRLTLTAPMVGGIHYRHIEISGMNHATGYAVTDSDGSRIGSRGYCTDGIESENLKWLEESVPGIRRNDTFETLVSMDFFCELGRATELIENVMKIAEIGDVMSRMPQEVLGSDGALRTRYRKIVLTDTEFKARYRVIDLSGSGQAMTRNYRIGHSGTLELRESLVIPKTYYPDRLDG